MVEQVYPEDSKVADKLPNPGFILPTYRVYPPDDIG
jgi:hypothetical protein